MNKEELFRKLEELNTVSVLSKPKYEEYRQILCDLEQLGVPPLSLTLRNEVDRQELLSSFSDKFISPVTLKKLTSNRILTVGDLLDLNRLDTLNFAGFGPKKWIELYAIQKKVYSLYPHIDGKDNGNDVIPPYSLQELIVINQEMLDLETAQVAGAKWDKNRYHELLVGLKKRGQKRADVYADEEIDDVPTDVLPVNGRIQTLLDSLGIQRLVQVSDITEAEVLKVSGQGRKAWTDIVELKKDIISSQASYLEKYYKYYMIRELPETNETLPLYKKCILAVSQLADILETRGMKRDSYLIREYFIKGTSVEDITKDLPRIGEAVVKERVRQITAEIQEKILSGSKNPIIGNAYFCDDFVDELNTLSQKIQYCPQSYANVVLQAPDDFNVLPILRVLGLDVLEITNDREGFMDAPRIISSDDNRSYITNHIKAVDFVMSLFAMPAIKDEIISEVLSSKYLPEKGEISIIEKLLDYHSWIDIQNGQYIYHYDKLKTAEAKAARIVYEKRNVTTSDIKEIDAQRMHLTPDQGMKMSAARVIAKYPWVAKGGKNNELIYKPSQVCTIPSLRVATERYAKKHVLFNFTDMVNYLKKQGYERFAESSFRSYVLKCCVPSNSDKNILCLESEIQNHDPSKWRSRTVQGTTNWVINSAVKILGDKKMKKSALNNSVLSQPEADNYNVRNIYSVYLMNYCCSNDSVSPNKLFITQDDYIWVNKQCLDEKLVDLETIGSVNKQPDYYMDVMTEIVNQLKQAVDQKMKLIHLKQACFPLITIPSKDTTFYKIINKLPDEVERIVDDGTIYLQLKSDKLSYEKTYSLPTNDQEVASVDNNEDSEPQLIETTKEEKVYVRGKIEWEDMASELKRELEYYNRWWDVKGITLDEGVDFFVNLLKSSQDKSLHDDVSRHIFEFLTQKLDRYDLHDHMKSIVLGAEPIIRSIYMRNNLCESYPKTHGLSECLALVPKLRYWVDDIFAYQNVTKYYDFRKTYLAFYGVRNKFAHGVSIDMNTGNKYLSTYSYLALYVYICCRFINS